MIPTGERSQLLTILNQCGSSVAGCAEKDCTGPLGCASGGECGSGLNDEQSRRRFLQGAMTFAIGSLQLTVLGDLGRRALAGGEAAAAATEAVGGPVYGFLVDSQKCIGSGKCLIACRVENNVPEGYQRTWIERYIHLKDGTVRVENVPESGVASLPAIDPETVDRSYFVPKLCNHCENPPCNQVCPVHAAFSSPEGMTLVDADRCVGCAYCVQACPYGARFINPDTGTADKCTWCYHRVKRNEQPACVEACPVGARVFGRIDDPQSEINQRLRQIPTHVLKEFMGTRPKTWYIGLSQEVI
jgi:Fe-S-cluster-containing dehydrogenase component